MLLIVPLIGQHPGPPYEVQAAQSGAAGLHQRLQRLIDQAGIEVTGAAVSVDDDLRQQTRKQRA